MQVDTGDLSPHPTDRGKCRILREILDLSLGSMVNSRRALPRCPSGASLEQPSSAAALATRRGTDPETPGGYAVATFLRLIESPADPSDPKGL